MGFQSCGAIDDQIGLGIEADRPTGGWGDRLARGERGKSRLGLVSVIGLGRKAKAARQNRRIGAVAYAGEGERTVEGDFQPRVFARRHLRDPVEETSGGDHGPHRMGR